MSQKQFNIEHTPLPIETVFFQEDVSKVVVKSGQGRDRLETYQDAKHWNRYYFDFPQVWQTSNVGEPIIGVRSIWLLNKRRHIEFSLFIRKYAKNHFVSAAERYIPRYRDHVSAYWLEDSIRYIEFHQPTSSELDQAVSHMNSEHISACCIPIDVIIEHDEDFRKIGEYLETHLSKVIEQINRENSGWIFTLNPRFVQESIDGNHGNRNRDVSIDEVYDNDTYKLVFGSPRNMNSYSANNDNVDLDCYVDIAIMPSMNTFQKLYDVNDKYKPLDEDYRQEILEETDGFSDDFNDVFNIGDEPYQNHVGNMYCFYRTIELKNLWDRHTTKVYASFANQASHNYLGNTHVYFTPIKYYILNSTDKKFWIELYSARNPNIPMRLPDHEGFVIEMQFMQNDKLLYI